MLRSLFGPLAARWHWVEMALRVQERFSAVRGHYLAAAVSLNFFTSLLPAVLVGLAVIGFFTSRSADPTSEIISNLGLTGQTAMTFERAIEDAQNSSRATSIIGVIGLIWAGFGLVAAIQYALDSTWQHSGRGIQDRLKGILWGLGAAVLLGASVLLTAIVSVPNNGWLLVAISAVGATAINVVFWMWTFQVLSFQKIAWRAYAPGSILAGIGLEVIKQAASLLGTLVSNTSAFYGSLAAAFAILVVLLIFGRLLVYSSVMNVVFWEKSHGTVTVTIEVPRVPGEQPAFADRAGDVQPG